VNKPIFGLLLGGALGVLDGLTAWFTPDVRPGIIGIVIGSTFKGLVAGICIGWFANKVRSLPLGVMFGLGIGMLLAFLVAAMQPEGKHYYFAIMLPGSLVGAIVGYATQKHRSTAEVDAART
jgi:hypothetical protein